MRAIEPTTDFGNADFLKKEIRRSHDNQLTQRLQAIRFRMLGKSVEETAQLCGVNRTSILTWVGRWNQGGVNALRTHTRPGRPCKIDSETKDWIVKHVEGTLPDGSPFRAISVHGYLKKKRPT